MAVREYEYRGLIADAWDALRGDTSKWPDRPFYLEMIRRAGEPVLDVGCGTGRLLLDYRAEGIDIDGVDNSPDMLAICRDKAQGAGIDVQVYQQHIEELELPRSYRTILIPSSTIQLVVDPDAALAAMVRIRNHLFAGGLCVASFMSLWRPGRPLESVQESTAPGAEEGMEYRRVARARYDPDSECEDTIDEYRLLMDGEVVREELHTRDRATRSYTPAQAIELFRAAGFDAVEAREGFTFDPAAENAPICTVSGVKSG